MSTYSKINNDLSSRFRSRMAPALLCNLPTLYFFFLLKLEYFVRLYFTRLRLKHNTTKLDNGIFLHVNIKYD